MNVSELYWIATNELLSLDIRYQAVRDMLQIESPGITREARMISWRTRERRKKAIR